MSSGIEIKPSPRRFKFAEVSCSTHTISQFLAELQLLLQDKALQPRTMLCLNAHVYNLARKNALLRQYLNEARVVTADGMAIVWAARLFGVRMAERCNMTEAFRAFLKAPDMPQNTALLIGCTPAEAEAASVEIHRLSPHCRVLKVFSGFLTDSEYREICQQYPAVDFIFLGMGTPRTEQVAELAAKICPKAIVWGVGGGTIRILAGTMHEAPPIWRRLGLQWLHRLICEPQQLWRRYLIGNLLFTLNILKAAWSARYQRLH